MALSTKPEVHNITLSSQEDRATFTANMFRKFREVWTWFLRYSSEQKPTDRHTDMLIAVGISLLHCAWFLVQGLCILGRQLLQLIAATWIGFNWSIVVSRNELIRCRRDMRMHTGL